MPYSIEEESDLMKVNIWGTTNKYELLEILDQVIQRNPGKQRPDLWTFAEETTVPFEVFVEISKRLEHATKSPVAPRSALLAANEFQKAQLLMFLPEAEHLPFEVNVFTCRDEAMQWLER